MYTPLHIFDANLGTSLYSHGDYSYAGIELRFCPWQFPYIWVEGSNLANRQRNYHCHVVVIKVPKSALFQSLHLVLKMFRLHNWWLHPSITNSLHWYNLAKCCSFGDNDALQQEITVSFKLRQVREFSSEAGCPQLLPLFLL